MSKTRYKELHSYIDSPLEKIRRNGARSLVDAELLELLYSDSAVVDSTGVQNLLSGDYLERPVKELVQITKLPEEKIIQMATALEITRRHFVQKTSPITSTNDLLILLNDLRKEKQEQLVCLSFDGGSRLIAQRVVTVGILDELIAHPREVFTDPISDRAAHIVIAHNHPSGNSRPSSQDIALTQQLAASGRVLGISLKDHLIVTEDDMFSFREQHLL